MVSHLATIRYNAQRDIHRCLAVPCVYQDITMSEPVALVARWGNKDKLYGDLAGDGYAQSIESADHVILEKAVSVALGCKMGGTLTFADYGMAFVLDVREPTTGPFSETWRVRRV